MTEFAAKEQAWTALNRVQRRIYRASERALAEQGLPNLKWYDVLQELDRAEEGLRPFALEGKLLFEQSSFSRQAHKMMDAGLIEQTTSPQDRRGRVLKLSAAGRAMRTRMWDVYRSEIDSQFSGLSAEMAQHLSALLAHLLPDPENAASHS
jgi:DNA-binding MarR family transcriptional regulator